MRLLLRELTAVGFLALAGIAFASPIDASLTNDRTPAADLTEVVATTQNSGACGKKPGTLPAKNLLLAA
jgi:hypothetical protein